MYGEGEQNAFFRLQVAIFQTVSDHSIFAWEATRLPQEAQQVIIPLVSEIKLIFGIAG